MKKTCIATHRIRTTKLGKIMIDYWILDILINVRFFMIVANKLYYKLLLLLAKNATTQ